MNLSQEAAAKMGVSAAQDGSILIDGNPVTSGELFKALSPRLKEVSEKQSFWEEADRMGIRKDLERLGKEFGIEGAPMSMDELLNSPNAAEYYGSASALDARKNEEKYRISGLSKMSKGDINGAEADIRKRQVSATIRSGDLAAISQLKDEGGRNMIDLNNANGGRVCEGCRV